MRKIIYFLSLVLLPTLLSANDYDLGKKLVTKLWRDYKNSDAHSMKKYISPAFQETVPSLQLRRNAKQELESLQQLHIVSFRLKSLKVKRQGKNLVTTYFRELVTVSNNEQVLQPFSIRLDVWQKVHGKWMWMAHQGGS